MQWTMWSVGANVCEERLLCLGVPANELMGLLEENIGTESLGLDDLSIVEIATVEISVVPNVGRLPHSASTMTVDLVEATVLRTVGIVVTHMPLAKHPCLVAIILEHLANRDLISPQHGTSHDGVPYPGAVRPVPRYKGRPRWGAGWSHMIVAQPNRLIGQLVYIGGLDHRVTRATKVTIALVIRYYKDDVWLPGRQGCRKNY